MKSKNVSLNNRASYVSRPSDKLVKNWQYIIARETIKQLKQRTTAINTEQLEVFINLKQPDLYDKLWLDFQDFILEEVHAMSCANQNISWLKPKLEQEYTKRVSNCIEKDAMIDGNIACSKLDNYLKDELRVASPNTAMNILKNASKYLLAQRRNTNNAKTHITCKIESATRSYRNIIYKKGIDFNLVIPNALNLIFKLKYEREWNEMKSQLALRLLEVVQNYYINANKTFIFLGKVENSLSNKCSVELSDFSVSAYLKPIDLNYQQLFLDSWMKCSINFWASNFVEAEEFEKRLLENIKDIAEERLRKFLK